MYPGSHHTPKTENPHSHQ